MVSLPNAETGTMDRISDDDDDEPSTGSDTYEEGDLLSAAMDDDVTAQLAAAGWQYKHINGDFHFFAFSLFFYSSIIVFISELNATLPSGPWIGLFTMLRHLVRCVKTNVASAINTKINLFNAFAKFYATDII